MQKNNQKRIAHFVLDIENHSEILSSLRDFSNNLLRIYGIPPKESFETVVVIDELASLSLRTDHNLSLDVSIYKKSIEIHMELGKLHSSESEGVSSLENLKQRLEEMGITFSLIEKIASEIEFQYKKNGLSIRLRKNI